VTPVNPHDPATWAADTIVVRCGSAQGVQELALTPQQFDAILGATEPNPVLKLDRWQPS